jgi:hypothetical protein
MAEVPEVVRQPDPKVRASDRGVHRVAEGDVGEAAAGLVVARGPGGDGSERTLGWTSATLGLI